MNPKISMEKTIRYTAIGVGTLGKEVLRNLPFAHLPGDGRFLALEPTPFDLSFEKYTAPRGKGNLIEYLYSPVEADSLQPFVETADVVVIVGALGEGPAFSDVARIAKGGPGKYVFTMPTRPFLSDEHLKNHQQEVVEILKHCNSFYFSSLNADLITDPDQNGTTYLSNAHTSVCFDVVYKLRRFLENQASKDLPGSQSFQGSGEWFVTKDWANDMPSIGQ